MRITEFGAACAFAARSNNDSAKRQKLFAGEDKMKAFPEATANSTSMAGEELTITGSFNTKMETSENYRRDINMSAPHRDHRTLQHHLHPVE